GGEGREACEAGACDLVCREAAEREEAVTTAAPECGICYGRGRLRNIDTPGDRPCLACDGTGRSVAARAVDLARQIVALVETRGMSYHDGEIVRKCEALAGLLREPRG